MSSQGRRWKKDPSDDDRFNRIVRASADYVAEPAHRLGPHFTAAERDTFIVALRKCWTENVALERQRVQDNKRNGRAYAVDPQCGAAEITLNYAARMLRELRPQWNIDTGNFRTTVMNRIGYDYNPAWWEENIRLRQSREPGQLAMAPLALPGLSPGLAGLLKPHPTHECTAKSADQKAVRAQGIELTPG